MVETGNWVPWSCSLPPSQDRQTKGRNSELSWGQFTRNSNGIRKQTVTATATVLITKIYKKRAICIQIIFSLTHWPEPVPNSSWDKKKIVPQTLCLHLFLPDCKPSPLLVGSENSIVLLSSVKWVVQNNNPEVPTQVQAPPSSWSWPKLRQCEIGDLKNIKCKLFPDYRHDEETGVSTLVPCLGRGQAHQG